MRTDPAGVRGPTRRQAAGPEWRRSSLGRYVPAGVELSPAQRVVEAGVLLPRGAAVTGWASLCWQGGRWFDGRGSDGRERPVVLACRTRGARPRELVAISEERVDPADLQQVDGLLVTSAVRSACFEARHASTLTEAVVALEMAYFDDLVSPDELSAWLAGSRTYGRVEQLQRALAVADENSWSPQETRMRGEWVATGLGVPLTNRPVFDLEGRHIGTPDLVDPVSGVLGEYEGAVHLTGRRRRRDLDREQAFREHGLEPVTAVSGDLGRPAGLHARLRSAYGRAARQPPGTRRWTLEQPAWWRPTETVVQRRALDGLARDIWLRHRRAS